MFSDVIVVSKLTLSEIRNFYNEEQEGFTFKP